jgi:hypothetical protein
VQTRFTSNIGSGSTKAKYIQRARIIIIDEVSMLTPWVARKVSLTLDSITETKYEQWTFGGKLILFVGDLLQLPPVVKDMAIPVVQRMITRMPCWDRIEKYVLTTPERCKDNEWNDFLQGIATGTLDETEKTWKQVSHKFGITLTHSRDRALEFLCHDVNPTDSFPLDRLWIAPTNQLVKEINQWMQEWRPQAGAVPLQAVMSLTKIIQRQDYNPGIGLCHQRDFTESIDSPDLPPHVLKLYEGDPCMLLRNISTICGLVKGRRCWALESSDRLILTRLDNQQELPLPRMPMEKVASGIKFSRMQVPIKLIYAGTVHRSQGMTLHRAVIDLRKDFWEHGQLYVALSRVTDPCNLCVLLPPPPERETEEEEQQEDIPIRVTVDQEMMNIISDIYKFRNETNLRQDETKHTEELKTTQEPVQILEVHQPEDENHYQSWIDAWEPSALHLPEPGPEREGADEEESDDEFQEINFEEIPRLGQQQEEAEHLPYDQWRSPEENTDEQEPENAEDQNVEQNNEDITARITERIRQDLPKLIMNWTRGEISLEEITSTIERVIEENWPIGPRREERLSHVLHAVLAQGDALMPQAPAEIPIAAKKEIMMKLFRMRILVAKFLVLLRWSRKYFNAIAQDMPKVESE